MINFAEQLNNNNMIPTEKKPLDIYIEQLPEVEDILDLKVPSTYLLIKPDNINTEVKTTSGIILAKTEEVQMMTLARGVVVRHGKDCQEIRTDDVVYFYKRESQGSFKSKDSEGQWEVYQLYQEYAIKSYLRKQ